MNDKQNRSIYKIALIGNPNSGKTTVFNGLTGSSQHIGNWPGVTVEKKEGAFRYIDMKFEVTDLPGIYSVSAFTEDERVARDFLLSGDYDLAVNIIDASNLERNLYLTSQLIEMKIPLLIVLNMADIAESSGISINAKELSDALDIKTAEISAVRKNDIEMLKTFIVKNIQTIRPSKPKILFPDEIEDLLSDITGSTEGYKCKDGPDARWCAIRLIEGNEGNRGVERDIYKRGTLKKEKLKERIKKIEKLLGNKIGLILAEYRNAFIHGIVKDVQKSSGQIKDMTDGIDRIVLNKFIGVPLFLTVMYFVFWTTMNLGGAFIDFFDILSELVFVILPERFLMHINAPQWTVALISGGIGTGMRTVSTFIPIIFTMFLMLSILEDSGYMARAAFIMDKFMRLIGLPGKSFIPLIVGFGCTVPAIMATRTLEDKRDRYLTIFMAPLMSCGARLPVYALFASAFFPRSGGLIVFSIYMAGIVLAILTGLMLKITLFAGEPSHFIIELPSYHMPRFRHIMLHTWIRLKMFIIKAGKMIVVSVAVLGFLNSISIDGTLGGTAPDRTVLSRIGMAVTPVFEPMGLQKDNWPASVSLITGIFAKESVIGTMKALYAQMLPGRSSETSGGKEAFDIKGHLVSAFVSVRDNLAGIFGLKAAPSGSADGVTQSIDERDAFERMKYFFRGGAFRIYAYMLFVLIYFPCIATFGAIIKETGILMATVIAVYLTLLGWCVSVLFYQLGSGRDMLFIILPILILSSIVAAFFFMGRSKLFN